MARFNIRKRTDEEEANYLASIALASGRATGTQEQVAQAYMEKLHPSKPAGTWIPTEADKQRTQGYTQSQSQRSKNTAFDRARAKAQESGSDLSRDRFDTGVRNRYAQRQKDQDRQMQQRLNTATNGLNAFAPGAGDWQNAIDFTARTTRPGTTYQAPSSSSAPMSRSSAYQDLFQAALNSYDQAQRDYRNYYSVGAIRDRLDEAQRQYDEASAALKENAYRARTAGMIDPEVYQARADAEENRNRLLNQYYQAQNEERFRQMSGSTAATQAYQRARTIRGDIDLINSLISGGSLTGGSGMMSRAETDSSMNRLKEQYGISGPRDLISLRRKLQEELTGHESSLQEMGYDFERMYGYESAAKQDPQYMAQQAEYQRMAQNDPVGSSLASIAASPFQGLDYLRSVAEGYATSDPSNPDTYVPMNAYDMDITNYVSAIRGTISQDLEKKYDWNVFGQNIASFLYNTGMSIADSAVQVGALGRAAALWMGSSAASNQAKKIMDQGGTSEQAILGGLAAGAAETIFEEVSIDKLLTPSAPQTIRQALRQVVEQAGVEASEEVLTEIANILSDAAIMGNMSDQAQAIKAYTDQGYTQQEARRKVFLDNVAQVVWAGAGGALSGGVMGGVTTRANYMDYQNYLAEREAYKNRQREIRERDIQRRRQRQGQRTEESLPPAGEQVPNIPPQTEPAEETRPPETLEEAAARAAQRDQEQDSTVDPAETVPAQTQRTQGEERLNLRTTDGMTEEQLQQEESRAAEIIERINAEVERTEALSDDTVREAAGSPYIVSAMVQGGYLTSTDVTFPEFREAFDNYNGTNDYIRYVQEQREEEERAAQRERGQERLNLRTMDQVAPENEGDEYERRHRLFDRAKDEISQTEALSDDTVRELSESPQIVSELIEYGKLRSTDVTLGEFRGALFDFYKLDDLIQQAQEEHAEQRRAAEEEQRRIAEQQRREEEARIHNNPRLALSDEQLEIDVQSAVKSADTLGFRGSRNFRSAYTIETARQIGPQEAFDGYRTQYQAALNGTTLTKEQQAKVDLLPRDLRTQARNAGLNDAAFQAQQAHFGAKSGIQNWSKARSYARKTGTSMRTLHMVHDAARLAGVQVRFGEDDENGSYSDGILTLSSRATDPVLATFMHEMVHRIHDISPEAYNKMARFVQENMSEDSYQSAIDEREPKYRKQYFLAAQQAARAQGMDERSIDPNSVLDEAVLPEEVVADAYGRMIGNEQTLQKFAQENRSVLQMVRDFFSDMSLKIRQALGKSNQLHLSSEQISEFRELQGKTDEMVRLFDDALSSIPEVRARAVDLQDQRAMRAAEALERRMAEPVTQDDIMPASEFEDDSEQAQRERIENSDILTRYSVREKDPPKKTIKAYKVFMVRDGKLYPPMVKNRNGAPTLLGYWLDAEEAPRAADSATGRPQVDAGGRGTDSGKMQLSYRPGWHAGDLPYAAQFQRMDPRTGIEKSALPYHFVWAEVEMAADIDYQEEAMASGWNEDHTVFKHSYAGLQKLPEDGYYVYRTNPNPRTVPWRISGSMKVTRILDDADVREILQGKEHKVMPRQGGDMNMEEFFLRGGDIDEVLRYQQERIATLKNQQRAVLQEAGVNPGEILTYDEVLALAESDGTGLEQDFNIEQARKAQWELSLPLYWVTEEGAGKKPAAGTRVTTSEARAQEWAHGRSIETVAKGKIYSVAWGSASEGYYAETEEGAKHKLKPDPTKSKHFPMRTDSKGRALSQDNATKYRGSYAVDENGNLQVVYASPAAPAASSLGQIGQTYSTKGTGTEMFLRIRNPLSAQELTMTKGEVDTIFKAFTAQEVQKAFGRLNQKGKPESKGDTLGWFKEEWFEGEDATTDIAVIDYLAEKLGDRARIVQALMNRTNDNGVVVGRDSLIIENEDGSISYVALKEGQAAPVQPDSAGQIRYSVREYADKLPNKTRFSMREDVERVGNLIALHNLSADNLLRAHRLGGFPMPSLAVTRVDIPHTNFGEITLVMDRDLVDPQADSRNTVYSADAWTPTFPNIEYEADPKVADRIRGKFYDLQRKYGRSTVEALYGYGNYLEDELNRYGGLEGVLARERDNVEMMRAYLADTGAEIPAEVTRTHVTRLDDETVGRYDFITDRVGRDVFDDMQPHEGETIAGARRRWMNENRGALESAYRAYLESTGATSEEIDQTISDGGNKALNTLARDVRNYLRTGPETSRTEVDEAATQQAIRDAVNQKAYESWLRNLFAGAEKNSGVYNNTERYKKNGDRRSFRQTHIPATLENIAQVMASQNGGDTKSVSGFAGIKTIRAAEAHKFTSVDEMHDWEWRLKHMTQEEADQVTKELGDRMADIIHRIYATKPASWSTNDLIEYDGIGNTLAEIAKKEKRTASTIKRAFSKTGYTVSDQIVSDIQNLLSDVSKMPVNIFEAKPERAVYFDSVVAAVVPSDVSQDVVSALNERGVNILYYESGNDAQRMDRVNSVQGVRFSVREGAQAQDDRRVFYTPAGVEVVKNPTDAEYRAMREEAYKEYPWLRGSGEPMLRYTYDEEGNVYYWNASAAMHSQVEPYINETFHTRTSQQWKWYESADKDDYPQKYAPTGRKVRFSTRQQQTPEEERLTRENKRQSKEIASLQRQVEKLRREITVTEPEASITDVRRKIRPLMQQYGLVDIDTGKIKLADVNELAPMVKDLYDRIIRNGMSDEVVDMAEDIARQMVDSALEYVDPDTVRELKGFRSYIRAHKIHITEDTPYQFAGGVNVFKEFRRENSNRLILSTKEGLDVDVYYDEARSHFPSLLSDVQGEEPKLRALLDAYTMIPPVQNSFQGYQEEGVQDLTTDLLWVMVKDPVARMAPTYAQRMEEKLAKERDKRREAVQRAIERERAKRDRMLQNLKDRQKQVAQRARERKQMSETRTKLLKVLRRLQDKNLPYVGPALKAQYLQQIADAIQTITGIQTDFDLTSKGMTAKKESELEQLRDWINSRREADPDFIPNEDDMKALQRLGKAHIAQLSDRQVIDLLNALLNIENEIRNASQLIAKEDRRQTYQLGEATIANISSADTPRNPLSRIFGEYIVDETLSPLRAMHRFTGYVDSDPLYRLTVDLNEGQRRMLDYQRRAEQPFAQYAEDRQFSRTFAGKNATPVEITGYGPGGQPTSVQISRAMLVSLALHSFNEQNLRHIAEGGITVPEWSEYIKGNTSEAYARGTTIKLRPTQVREIVSQLTEQERQFVRDARHYFRDVSQPSVNQVSNLLIGHDIASVEDYFPINTDNRFTRAEFETVKQDGSIEGMGWLKERVAHAKNPILLRDVNDVLSQAIRMHSQYVGMAIPVRNFNKVWNVTTTSYDEVTGEKRSYDGSVKSAFESKWGKSGSEYVENMMADIQSRVRNSNKFSRLLGAVRSNYAGAVLTLNLSVAMKQAASYPTAAAVIGFRPLLRALADTSKVNTDLVARYTPLLWYRSKGFSTQELGDIAARGQRLPVPLNWIQGADVITTQKLWQACEYYVRDNNRNLERGSDAYYRAVADVYNQVIEETQPNYTTMQRPAVLRHDDTLLANLSMFKTQLYQNFNIFYHAAGNMIAKRNQLAQENTDENRTAYRQAQNDFRNAFTSQVAQLAVITGMTFAWALLRGKKDKYQDEDGKMTLSSLLSAFGKDVAGSIMGTVPWGTQAWDLFSAAAFGDEYYGVDATTTSALTDMGETLVDATDFIGGLFETAEEGGTIDWNKARLDLTEIATGLAKAAGIPAENVLNLLTSVSRIALKKTQGTMGDYYYMLLTEDPSKSTQKFYNLLYQAYQSDPAAYQEMYDDMVSSGSFDADKLASAMEKRMKETAGVDKSSELDQRYLNPTQQEEYDATLDGISDSRVWNRATEDQRKYLTNDLYGLVTDSKAGAKLQTRIDEAAAHGVSEEDYLLYRLALRVVDQPTESGAMGSYTNEEVQEAIDMLTGLSRSAKSWLWTSQGKSDKNNPYS